MSKIIKILTDNSDPPRDYYCSMKFRYLKIDLESSTTYNCHAATPHAVDFNLIEKSPGSLFNTELSVAERHMMLNNERNSSCEQNCWPAEDVGAMSPRLYQKGTERTHIDVITSPEIIDLTINSDCNLTCSYCCKEYSSAWRRDIIDNGNYILLNEPDRYQAVPRDITLNKLSQKTIKSTKKYKSLLKELTLLCSNVKVLIVTGGEPLLDNSLVDMLVDLKLPTSAKIELYTGLGVSYNRLSNMLDKLKVLHNVSIIVSAESTGSLAEFNRYGIKWDEFLTKVQLVEQKGFDCSFNSTITNLNVFGFNAFYETFKDKKIRLTFSYTPKMLAPYVLDRDSKALIKKNISSLPIEFQQQILDSIEADPSPEEISNLKTYLNEFTRRRPDLSLDIFPKTFLNWINSVV